MDRHQIRKMLTGEALAKADLSSAAAPLLALHLEEWTDPATADVDAFATASVLISSTSNQTFTAADDFDGASAGLTISPPRNVTLTLSSHANWDATTAVVTGTDITGAALTENFTIPDAGNATVTGAKAFATVTSIYIPAQSGTAGTATLGFGALIGLAKKAKSLAGEPLVILEVAAGAIVTTGVFATADVGLPFGTYAPNAAPDASKDYAIIYVLDAA